MLDYTKPLQFRDTGNRAYFVGHNHNGQVVVEDTRGNLVTIREPEIELQNCVAPKEYRAEVGLVMTASGFRALDINKFQSSSPHVTIVYSETEGWRLEEVK